MSFYTKWEQNYIPKLHSMTVHFLRSWFKKKNTERRKASFLKETVENEDPHEAVLIKTMTIQD